MRKSKIQSFLDIAKEVAERSPCSRRRFGAIIVQDGDIVSTGYNGTAPGTLNCGIDIPCLKDLAKEASYTSYDNCPAIHAEENACVSAGRQKALGGTLYLAPALGVGDRPCFICRRMIMRTGLEAVVYVGRDGETHIDLVADYVAMENEWMMKKLEEISPDMYGCVLEL